MNILRNVVPFSVDPFDEAGITEKERNSMLIRDFLDSYWDLSSTVAMM